MCVCECLYVWLCVGECETKRLPPAVVRRLTALSDRQLSQKFHLQETDART